VAQTRKDIREAYNKKAYKQYNFRVRRDSELFRWLEQYKDDGNAVNELVIQRLEIHFKHLVKIGVLEQ
jgi:hypothetical protein